MMFEAGLVPALFVAVTVNLFFTPLAKEKISQAAVKLSALAVQAVVPFSYLTV
jgi:hypothetical protein